MLKLVFFLFAITYKALCYGSIANKPDASRALSPLQFSALSNKQYRELAMSAVNGSVEAAWRLYMSASTTNNFKEAIYWASIASENGDEDGRYQMALILVHSPLDIQRNRGIYWLKRLAKLKYSDAEELLNKYDLLEKRNMPDIWGWPAAKW